ncbi:DNA repair ATPase [Robertkochia solimangrovi]|uniref:DNA repair ATPase n=1 Tax=Robertkochia solimangrovi TaxID=2213046 RepID=UPI001180EACB|nr:DNA repair ATPase [Robertkochia solimangrovi]TRZ43165.1 AAA family ATPase [Robertkochia solimangrovi]
MNKEEVKNTKNDTLDGGTYEIIQKRLSEHKSELQNRLNRLNESRKSVFGSLETQLIANNRISTENNCVARDMISLGNTCIFGYNVHFGLRTEIKLSDVFSIYEFKENRFESIPLTLINDETFTTDFSNLYKYYRNTIFTKFAKIGNYLHMVFQLSESVTDIKTFKWLIRDNSLQYIDNRSEHEYKFPKQHQFNWQEATRDMQRYGDHPHVAILDKVFVETVGGDLTIKIEDNTDDGKGIYAEPVDYRDQTLDDGQIRFADLGNLIVLEIKPFQESPRYFVYNHKMQEVKKIESVKSSVVLLPDNQGIIFPNGYYLQTGEFHLFDNEIEGLKFQGTTQSPNGEDFLYTFFSPAQGNYILMDYNIIEQEIKTPITCGGFTLLEHGELCYFKTEAEQTKHHMIQIWQTPYIQGDIMPSEHQDSMLYKIGNKDIVKAMAESQELITLLNKQDNYDGLYEDIARQSKNILDAYYWLNEQETAVLSEPLREINMAANAAVDEFQKVTQLRNNAVKLTREIQKKGEDLFGKIKSTSFKSIDEFVMLLTGLRALRGEAIGLYEIRYIDEALIKKLEADISEQTSTISRRCVEFLLQDKALQPYHKKVEEKQQRLKKIKKVMEAKELEEEVSSIASELEMLIDIVSNLDIEDTAHSTQIIDNISLIFSTINQLKAAIRNARKSLGSKEATADFAAQLKLIDQSIINYLDMAVTPEKCDEFQTKVSIQLEELEGKFSDFEEFISRIIEKREEVYSAFESKKSTINEKRNKKAIALQTAAERILKSISKKAESLKSASEINGYYASDLMVNKLRDIVDQLRELDDSGNAEEIETAIKTSREDAHRKLKDKQDLYEDGENIIRLGNHKFGVNRQEPDLSIVYKENRLFYHITGTDFYQPLDNAILNDSKAYWNQEFVSENENVYRASFLAYKLYTTQDTESLSALSPEQLLSFVQEESGKNYTEGYVKGVHDFDTVKILTVLLEKHRQLGILKYSPSIRACARYFWEQLDEEKRAYYNNAIKASGHVLRYFPKNREYDFLVAELEKAIGNCNENTGLFPADRIPQAALYLFEELQSDDSFTVSIIAKNTAKIFLDHLKKEKATSEFETSVKSLQNIPAKVRLIRQWLQAYIRSAGTEKLLSYTDEIACCILFPEKEGATIDSDPNAMINELKGEHSGLAEGKMNFNYHEFSDRLQHYFRVKVPAFQEFRKTRHEVTLELKHRLKLEEFKPRVLTSFVRNKLIDQVYFPLFGENLSKQLGSLGDNRRTDRMGMLLLISPPGYGKTTLMEYIANRLGLVFMKINGPAIGHEVTSVDPESAGNSAAREELKKLNLAFEMGNNVMLYLDDIQHCNPEFLQKFISLADGTRKIEGVFNGNPKTYDLRGKKFCVIMAGNPYTESGEKFRIPDMLANRADIYNLGDIIGDTADLFKLSLIENSLTSNPVLHQLSSRNFEDVYKLIEGVEQRTELIELSGNHTQQEIADYKSVLNKVLTIRNTVLKVNETYIRSAGMEDEYRTEPAFKLQGSYRDMNKLVSKIVPIMNDKELDNVLLSHYENESQTLTAAAEANLLKFKELHGVIQSKDQERWNTIKETFVKNNKLKGIGENNEMAQLLMQLMNFGENLEGIKKVLSQGFSKNGN